MTVRDPYTTRPDNLEKGDVLVAVVKAMIDYEGHVRLYRTPWSTEFEPQGDRILTVDTDVASAAFTIFPVLMNATVVVDSPVCVWYDDDKDRNLFHTECGHDIKLTDDLRPLFSVDFCPRCGKKIVLGATE